MRRRVRVSDSQGCARAGGVSCTRKDADVHFDADAGFLTRRRARDAGDAQF